MGVDPSRTPIPALARRPRLAQLGLILLIGGLGCGEAPPSETPSPTATVLDVGYPTPTATPSPTTAQTPSPTPSPTPSSAPTASPSPTDAPTGTAPPTPTEAPTPTASPSPSPSPTPDQTCQPALGLTPEAAEVPTLSVLTFVPRGGTGDWHFELIDSPSGAIVNTVTGAYISGDVGGGVDRIRLWDGGCVGEAIAEVQVFRPLSVRPLKALVPAGGQLTPAIEEGSGRSQCTLSQAGSGAHLQAPCTYVAGPSLGYDQLAVEDLATGERILVDLEVRSDPGPHLEAEALFIPVGGRLPLRISGGSGWAQSALLGEGVALEEGALNATAPGESRLTVVDAFTGVETSARVVALPSLAAPVLRAGERLMAGRALGPGDLNGDGFPDALLAMPESDIKAYNGGVIYLYAGTEGGGLEPTPARMIVGDQWEGELGRDLFVADLDGDGLRDLAVGAPREDWGSADAGAVYIYRGVEGGFFEETPSQRIDGEAGSDWFGYGLASCDLNQDGWADLAVGAIRDQNNDVVGIPSDTGAVHLFLGGPKGFAREADRILYGVAPTASGELLPYTDLRAGDGLAAGDLNGDGRCDLVVGAYQYDRPNDTNAGMVFAYLGREAAPGQAFGMGPDPDVIVESMAEGGETAQLGRRFSLGDLNQDGRDDLIIGHWLSDGAAGTRPGAVRIFFGRADFDALGWVAAEDADRSLEGGTANNYLGFEAVPGDLDGDGAPELLVGEMQGELTLGPSNTGRVLAFIPETEAHAAGILGEYGLPEGVSGDYFGEAIAALVDDEGVGTGGMLVLAGRDDSLGYDVGRPFLIREGQDALALEMPGEAAGTQLGRGVALFGDRIAIGAPLEDPQTNSVNHGGLHLYVPGAPEVPDQSLDDFPGLNGGDQLGYALSAGGDFNGDGREDLFVASLQDDAPTSFGADYDNPLGCSSPSGNTGAALVFLGREGGGVGDAPDLIYYGLEPSTRVSAVAGGFDFNGDGLSDLAAASYDWDGRGTNIGGIEIVLGRAPSAETIEVLCDPILTILGRDDNGQLGYALSPAGDLNGDGCDEVAVGAPFADAGGLSNQGEVLILFGFGGDGCPAGPTGAMVLSGVSNTQLGTALSGGLDVDGDGIPDLAIGARNNQVGDDRPGSAFVLSGASLGGLPTAALVSGSPLTLDEGPTLGEVHILATVHGRTHLSLFGQSLALVPQLSSGGRAGLAVGLPQGDDAGTALTGGARIYRFEGEALTAIPAALFVGEADHVDNRLGEVVSAGVLGGEPAVVVGGYRGSGFGVDVGSAYVMDLSRASDVP